MLNLKIIQSIYFVGIGGISMSALAKLMKSEGKTVCGSDDNLSQITENLKELGIKVFEKFDEESIKNCDLLVYTQAIPQNNKNIVLAKKLGKQIMERAKFLGEVCKTYKEVIAVCGTHGKTTTTAMLAHILESKNPTVHVGGIMSDGSNLKIGSKNLFITEACEFNKSFLHISPTHTIVTNIEKDHMDCYKNFEELTQTFVKFLQKTSKNIVFNYDFLKICNQNFANKIFSDKNFANKNFITFSQNKNATYFASNLKEKNGRYSFDINSQTKPIGKVRLQVVGKHNVLNAMAAISMALNLGVSEDEIIKKMNSFQNAKRRFEVLFDGDILVISDYAHHPTEIKANIEAAKSLNHGKIVCIFEPHTYSRTKALFDEFLCAFDDATKTIILKTYAAREKENMGYSGHKLFCELKKKNKNCTYCDEPQKLFQILNKIKEKGDIFLFLGAGTIDAFARKYAKTLEIKQSF